MSEFYSQAEIDNMTEEEFLEAFNELSDYINDETLFEGGTNHD